MKLYKLVPAALLVFVLTGMIILPASAADNVLSNSPRAANFAPGSPTFSSISPSSGLQGQTITCTIIGWFQHTATAIVFSGSGITAGTPSAPGWNYCVFTVAISPTAAAGLRNITETFSGYSPLTSNNVFTVIAAPPTITSITPNSARVGQTLDVVIQGTNFNGTVTVAVSGGDVRVNSVTVNSSTQLTINITIPGDSMPSERNVTVNAFGGSTTFARGFTVLPGQGVVNTGSPGGSSNAGAIGTQAPVSLTNIVTSSASLSAGKVAPGTPVTVTANVQNRSAVNGTTKLTLYVNGQEEASQGLIVNSGSSTPVTFTVTRNEPGTYTVYVGGTSAGSFVVDEFSDPNLMLYVSIAFVSIASLAGMFLLTRRRQQ